MHVSVLKENLINLIIEYFNPYKTFCNNVWNKSTICYFEQQLLLQYKTVNYGHTCGKLRQLLLKYD